MNQAVTTSNDARDKLTGWRLVPIFLLGCLGQIPPLIAPFIFAALTKGLALSSNAAATTVSIEIGCIALTLGLLMKFLAHVNFRTLAVIGTLIIIAGQWATLSAPSYPLLLLARAACGIGAGFSIAIAFAIFSRHKNPALLFSLQTVFLTIFLISVLGLLPYASAVMGHLGLFLALALSSLFIAPFALAVRTIPVPQQSQPSESRGSTRSAAWSIAMAAITALSIASNALWLHYEALGEFRQISSQTLVASLTFITVLMVLLPYLTLRTYQRYMTLWPILIATLVQVVCAAVYLLVPDRIAFLVSVNLLNILFVFQMIYARMLSADSDPSGRLAVGVGSGEALGNFLGPMVGGAFSATLTTEPTWFLSTVMALMLLAAAGTAAAEHMRRNDRRFSACLTDG